MAIICFDYGHGGKDPGAVYRGRKEKDDNLEIGQAIAIELRKFGVIVDETRNTDKTLSLKERSDYEKRKTYDYFVSFHRNAFKAEKARGLEIYVYRNGNIKSKNLAHKIQSQLVGLGFKDRGIKEARFHMLRETKAPALLIELGFIDNTFDNDLFVKKKDKIIKATSKAILESLNISMEKDIKEEIYYRVMTGSFKMKENANKRVKDLKDLGFDSSIVSFVTDNKGS